MVSDSLYEDIDQDEESKVEETPQPSFYCDSHAPPMTSEVSYAPPRVEIQAYKNVPLQIMPPEKKRMKKLIIRRPRQPMTPDSVSTMTPEDPALLSCAVLGCIFSWIPCIGCSTFILHIDGLFKHQGSTRGVFAALSCSIAMFATMTLIVFLVIWFH